MTWAEFTQHVIKKSDFLGLQSFKEVTHVPILIEFTDQVVQANSICDYMISADGENEEAMITKHITQLSDSNQGLSFKPLSDASF